MINPTTMKNLFKPYEIEVKNPMDIIIKKVGERKFWKIQFEDECSKSIDESCINIDCPHNYLKYHKKDLYIELRKEIDDYWLEVEKRNAKYRKNHGFGGDA